MQPSFWGRTFYCKPKWSCEATPSTSPPCRLQDDRPLTRREIQRPWSKRPWSVVTPNRSRGHWVEKAGESSSTQKMLGGWWKRYLRVKKLKECCCCLFFFRKWGSGCTAHVVGQKHRAFAEASFNRWISMSRGVRLSVFLRSSVFFVIRCFPALGWRPSLLGALIPICFLCHPPLPGTWKVLACRRICPQSNPSARTPMWSEWMQGASLIVNKLIVSTS